MKWSEGVFRIVDSFNRTERPGFALAALAVVMLSLVSIAGLALLGMAKAGSSAASAIGLLTKW